MTVDTVAGSASSSDSEQRRGHYRYPGAPPFGDTELDRRLFRGRAEEAETVLHSILSSDLFLLYAESGLGKTSLLNAGVLHELRARGHWPVSVRLNDTSRSPVEGIRDQILEAAARDPFVDLHIDDNAPGSTVGASLWDLLASIEVWRGNDLLRIVLILDQFEELFTLGWDEAERVRFITEFGEVARHHRSRAPASGIELPPADVRFVLVIREDSLGSLEALSADIPKIMRNRFRLGPLQPDQAEAAIREPAGIDDERLESHRFEYTQAAATEILDFLRTSSVFGATTLAGGVDPSQLQIVCQYVERAIVPEKSAEGAAVAVQIDADDLGGRSGLDRILSEFYRRTIQSLPAAHQRHVRELCEQGLINRNGRRLSLELDVIGAEYGVSPATLQALVDGRLLRAEPRVGSVYYELAHDTLVAAILADRDERQVQRRRRRRNAIVAAATLVAAFVVAVAVLSAVRSGSATSLTKNLQLARPETVRLDAESGATLAVEDPDGGALEIAVAAGAGSDVSLEVTDQTGSSTTARTPLDGGVEDELTVVMFAPVGEPAMYDVRVSSPESASRPIEIVANELAPTVLSDARAEATVEVPGQIVLYEIDVQDRPRVIDVEPVPASSTDDPTLDLVVELGAVDMRGVDMREVTDRGRGAVPERVVVAEPGRRFVIVRGAGPSTGGFRIAATDASPAFPGSPGDGFLPDDGGAYFEIPGDGVRAVLVTPLDDDLDLEMQVLVDGEEGRAVDDGEGREFGFTTGSGGSVLVHVQRSARSDASNGDFRVEVSEPLVRFEPDVAPEPAANLTVFELSNDDADLLVFVASGVLEDAGPDDGGQSDDALMLDVFDAQGFRIDLSTIDLDGGGVSLILDGDDPGPYAVVVSTPSASDDTFEARFETLANPEPGRAPIAASGSRPFSVTVNEGEQVEFVALVDNESGPPLEIAWTELGDEAVGRNAKTFLAGDSLGVVLGCNATTSGSRQVTVDVTVFAEAGRSTDYEVQVRANRVDESTIDWCGPLSSPSQLIGPTFVALLTRSGAAPEQAYCVSRAWFAGGDGEPGLDREIQLFETFAVAASAEDPTLQQVVVDGIEAEFDPFLRDACGVGEFAIERALLLVDALVKGDPLLGS